MHVWAEWSLTWNSFHSLLMGCCYFPQCQNNPGFLKGQFVPFQSPLHLLALLWAWWPGRYTSRWPQSGLGRREIQRWLVAWDVDLEAQRLGVKSPRNTFCCGCGLSSRVAKCKPCQPRSKQTPVWMAVVMHLRKTFSTWCQKDPFWVRVLLSTNYGTHRLQPFPQPLQKRL